MRVLVCGGREFGDTMAVYDKLDEVHRERGITQIIHGAARGADRLARDWAKSRNVPEAPYPANWTLYGKAAGPMRNQRMLDEAVPDMVVAFPGGRGTADMVERARLAGVPVEDRRARAASAAGEHKEEGSDG